MSPRGDMSRSVTTREAWIGRGGCIGRAICNTPTGEGFPGFFELEIDMLYSVFVFGETEELVWLETLEAEPAAMTKAKCAEILTQPAIGNSYAFIIPTLAFRNPETADGDYMFYSPEIGTGEDVTPA